MSFLPLNPVEITSFLGLLSAIILLISRLDLLVAFFQRIELSRTHKVIKAQNYKFLSDNMSKSLSNAVDKTVFSKIYKLNLNKPYREKILKIERMTKGSIDCDDFMKVGSYIKYKNDEIYVLQRPWYNHKKNFDNIIGFSCLIFGIIVLLFLIAIPIISKNNQVQYTLLDLFFIATVGISYIYNAINLFKDINKLQTIERMVFFSKKHPNILKINNSVSTKNISMKLHKFNNRIISTKIRDKSDSLDTKVKVNNKVINEE